MNVVKSAVIQKGSRLELFLDLGQRKHKLTYVLIKRHSKDANIPHLYFAVDVIQNGHKVFI